MTGGRVIDVAQYLTGGIALSGALYRIWVTRGRRGAEAGTLHLIAFTLCLSASMALLPLGPAMGLGTGPMGRLVPLLGAELKLAAECFLALLALAVDSSAADGSRERRQRIGSVLVMAASAVAYLASGAASDGVVVTVDGGGRAAMAGYNLLALGHSSWCVGFFALVVHRTARQVAPGLLRVGLRVVEAGALSGLAWSLLNVVPLVTVLRSGQQNSAEDAFSAPVALTTLVLGVGGASLTAWAGPVTGAVRRLRARRDHRRLGPMWSALYAARPEIALETPAGRLNRPGAEFALYRRVIEIRDGQLALRRHLHYSGGEARFDSVAAVAADLGAEAVRLVLVAEAFTSSPVVAEVRRRMRAELARENARQLEH